MNAHDVVFPTVLWGETRATFVPLGASLPIGKTVASLVFAKEDGQFVLADIAGRGWCIPGGRLEAGETAEQAARRETWEEIGATLGPLYSIGHCVLLEPASRISAITSAAGEERDAAFSQVRWIAMYLADVVERIEQVPPGSESQGVRRVPLESLSGCYFTWDPLMEAMFHYAETLHAARERETK